MTRHHLRGAILRLEGRALRLLWGGSPTTKGKHMSTLPKAIVRHCSNRLVDEFFDPSCRRWEVTLADDPTVESFDRPIAESDNHRDALAYAHRLATIAQRHHVEKLERNAREARAAALNARPKPRVKISITSDDVEEFKKAKARIEAHENLRACYGR